MIFPQIINQNCSIRSRLSTYQFFFKCYFKNLACSKDIPWTDEMTCVIQCQYRHKWDKFGRPLYLLNKFGDPSFYLFLWNRHQQGKFMESLKKLFGNFFFWGITIIFKSYSQPSILTKFTGDLSRSWLKEMHLFISSFLLMTDQVLHHMILINISYIQQILILMKFFFKTVLLKRK